MDINIRISTDKIIDGKEVLELYSSVNWSSANKPKELIAALKNAHTLITAYSGVKLVGLAYTISDGHLVVYLPHMLVHPDFQDQGIGALIMERYKDIYKNFHMQMLTADGRAVDFYAKHGFERAGKTVPMWIYKGGEH